jgi:hypothetical protein
MCGEREQLLAFVYDESDGQERRALERHLDECASCRDEVNALRQVRQDLLAWEVPSHRPIWRPPVTERPTLSWRDVPAWALTAAASLVLAVGAAGGAVTQAFLARPAAVPPVVASPALVATAPSAPSVTPAELAALEARVLDRMRTEVEARVTQQVRTLTADRSDTAGRPRAVRDESAAEVARKVEELRNTQAAFYTEIYKDNMNLKQNQRSIQ